MADDGGNVKRFVAALILALALVATGCDSDAGMDMIHGSCSETADCPDGDSCVSGQCLACYDLAYHSWYVCDSCTWAAEIGGRTVDECRDANESNVLTLENLCGLPEGDGRHSDMLTCYAEGRCDCE